MTIPRPLAVLAAATALALCSALPATAAGDKRRTTRNWTQVDAANGALLLVCQQAAQGGKAIKVSAMVDASQATSVVSGGIAVRNSSVTPVSSWTSGWLNPGTVSPVGSLTMPASDAYYVTESMGIGGPGGTAGGGVLDLGTVSTC